MKAKISLSNLCLFILSLIIIFNCDSIFKWNYSIDDAFKTSLLVIMICLSFLFIICTTDKKMKIKKSNLEIGLFLLIFFILYGCLNISFIKNYTFFFVPFLCLWLIYVFRGIKAIMALYKYFSLLLVLISLISLFFYLMGSVFNIITPSGEFIMYVNNVPKRVNNYFFLYFEPQNISLLGNTYIRNCAFFYEAPKFSVLLSFAMIYELYFASKINKKSIMILSLTIISTISTTGIVFLLALFFSKVFFSERIAGYSIIKKVFSVIIFITFICVTNFLSDAKIETSSFSARIDDYIAGYRAWLDHIFIGNGYGNTIAIIQYMSLFRKNNIGFSNSIFRVLAYGGLYLSICYIFAPLLYLCKNIRKKRYKCVILAASYFYFLIFVSFAFSDICTLLLLIFMDGIANPEYS